MEKINIAKLLKDCPTGMELDCALFENLEFDHTDEDNGAYSIICRVKTEWGSYNVHTFTEYGCYNTEKYSKCVIFPKGKTTWEGFQRPFKDGDVAISEKGDIHLLRTKDSSYCAYRERWEGLRKFDYTITTGIKIVRFATSEEKEKLFKAIKDNGYKWNAETKTLEKLPEFKAGDVLVSKMGNIVLCDYIDDKQVVHYHCVLDPFGYIMIKNDIGVGKSFHCTLATDAEKQRLFDRLKSAGYKYNPQTNKLEKLIEPKFKVGDRIKKKKAYISGIITDISNGTYKVEYKSGGVAYANIEFQDDWELVPNKFDITTLKAFDKVLTKTTSDGVWANNFFGYYKDGLCYCSEYGYRYCIPFEGNQHLLGTTNDCDEFYKTWE